MFDKHGVQKGLTVLSCWEAKRLYHLFRVLSIGGTRKGVEAFLAVVHQTLGVNKSSLSDDRISLQASIQWP